MINVIEKRTRRKQEKCDISKYLRNDSGYPINYFICEKGNFMNRTYRILYDANLRFMLIALIIFGLVWLLERCSFAGDLTGDRGADGFLP